MHRSNGWFDVVLHQGIELSSVSFFSCILSCPWTASLLHPWPIRFCRFLQTSTSLVGVLTGQGTRCVIPRLTDNLWRGFVAFSGEVLLVTLLLKAFAVRKIDIQFLAFIPGVHHWARQVPWLFIPCPSCLSVVLHYSLSSPDYQQLTIDFLTPRNGELISICIHNNVSSIQMPAVSGALGRRITFTY